MSVQARGRPLHQKLALAIEIVATYVQVRARLRNAPLPTTVASLRGCSPLNGSAEALEQAVRFGHAVRRTLRLLPTGGDCLTQSLVLTKLLARRGIASELVIGVTPGERFGAHAWVERENVALLPAHRRRFERLARL